MVTLDCGSDRVLSVRGTSDPPYFTGVCHERAFSNHRWRIFMLQFTGFSESGTSGPCGTGEIRDCGGRAGVSGTPQVLRELVLPKLEGPQCIKSYLMIATGWEKSHPVFFLYHHKIQSTMAKRIFGHCTLISHIFHTYQDISQNIEKYTNKWLRWTADRTE
jgi:hypothetical protein